MQDFVHLHVHTQYSLLDGQASVSRLVDKAMKDGMKGIAVTDHGNMFGIKEFYNYVNKKNSGPRGEIKDLKKRIAELENVSPRDAEAEAELAACRNKVVEAEGKLFKPIIGCEMYVARRTMDKREGKPDQSGWHLIVLAKNEKGYHNLIKLVSRAWTKGYYMRPRTDRTELEKYHEGLIVCSACLGGEIPKKIIAEHYDEAEEAIQWYKNLFGDDYYLELQRHKATVPRANHEAYPLQQKVNAKLVEYARKYNIKLICTNDVHFVDEENAEAHDRLICLSTGKDLDDPTRMLYTKQEWMKTKAEMNQLFEDIPEALSNTLEILDKVEYYSIDHAPIMPTFAIPEDFGTEEEYGRSRRQRQNQAPGRIRETVPHQTGSRLPGQTDLRRRQETVWRPALRRSERTAGVRALYHEDHGFPGLLPHRAGLHQRRPHPTGRIRRAGTWLGGRLGGSLLPGHHQDRPHSIRPAVRALPEPRPYLIARYRRGLRR